MNNGGPAFPGNENWMNDGMSLRDWFAGMYMSGIYANRGYAGPGEWYVAQDAYKVADAMLKEREK